MDSLALAADEIPGGFCRRERPANGSELMSADILQPQIPGGFGRRETLTGSSGLWPAADPGNGKMSSDGIW